MMYLWPRSVSDYKWPRNLLSWRWAPRRWWGAILFHAGHLAGRLTSLFHPNRPGVLVVRTDGIGDAVLAEPMMQSLARRYADQEFHLWAPAATCELLRAVPYIDRRMVIPRGFRDGNVSLLLSPWLRAKLGYRLGRWRYAAVFYVAHSPEPLGNWLLKSARARQRWYSPGDTENQFAAQRTATAVAATHWLRLEQSGGHDLERNSRIAAKWGGDITQTLPTVHLDQHAFETAGVQSRAWRQSAAWLGATAVVGLMPAASMAVKKYPAAQWAAAAADLWNQRRIICALLGGPGDGEQVEEVSAQLGSLPHLKMADSLDLPAMSALVGSLDGLLGVDTGLAHIAMAQAMPTVVLVGGGHPGRFFPWPGEKRAITLNHAMPCQGCLNRCHLSEPECLTHIYPAQIVTAICELLDRPLRRPLPLRAAG